MATIRTIKYCEKEIARVGIRDIKTGKLTKIAFELFGIRDQLDDSEFMKLSETEQRRHRREDAQLIAVYGKDSTKLMFSVPFDKVTPCLYSRH